MNVKQLKTLIAGLPADLHVVFRMSGSSAAPISGIHIRPYDPRRRHIFEPNDDTTIEDALVLNPYK